MVAAVAMPERQVVVQDHLVGAALFKMSFSLAWLLGHSPVMLPIPGTGSVDHLRENCGAAEITLTAEDRAAIEAAASA